MNSSNKGLLDSKDAKLIEPNRVTCLNPNATEFVPSSFSSPIWDTNNTNSAGSDISGPSSKSVFDRSESNISVKSDEAEKYWADQLPDDITPDFKNMGEVELSLANLSLHDNVENANFEDYNAQQFTSGNDGTYYHVDYSTGFSSNYMNEQNVIEDSNIDPIEYLTSQFPGFATESLADVYYANGCDLNSTIEMLTQLELQADPNSSQNTNTKSSQTPNFNVHEFPALSSSESNNESSVFNREDLHQASNKCRSPSNMFQGTIDFASTVRKLALQDSTSCKYERRNAIDASMSTSQRSHIINSSNHGNGRSSYGDKVRSSASGRGAPVWLETGESVANLYSELRGDARDLARVRNAYFEQARQAYLIGNGSLAKELSRKGQLYNMQMKVAHGKARETIYRQRNQSSLSPGSQDQLIDLHGLHVTEAIQVLQHELTILKSVARSQAKRVHVMICVGTGHHTKGARTPARLPVAVEQYLLEEGLRFTQPQPGLLRVLLY